MEFDEEGEELLDDAEEFASEEEFWSEEEFDEPRAAEHLEQNPRLAALGAIADFGVKRLTDLAATPVEWVWKDYATTGSIVVIAGQPGGGKTTALFQILLARCRYEAAGNCSVCDREVAAAPFQKSLLLIEGEHSSGSTARKLLRLSTMMKLPIWGLERLIIVARKSVLIGDNNLWQQVEELVRQGLISDLAIDTLARCSPYGTDANSEAAQTEIFDRLARAIEAAPSDSKPVVWVLTHTRKQGPEKKPPTLDDVSGSMQRAGQADSVIVVAPERDSDGRIDHSKITLLKAREEPDDYPPTFEMRLGVQPAAAGLGEEERLREKAKFLLSKDPRMSTRQLAEKLKKRFDKAAQLRSEILGTAENDEEE